MPELTTDLIAELRTFFEEYVARFNDALEGRPDLEGIAEQYTDAFLAAGPTGVMPGQNDEEFVAMLGQVYERYRAIGTQHMAVRDTHVTPIDEQHAMVRVDFHSSYVRQSDQEPVEIDFDVTYLLQRQDRWRVFAFVAGDEEGALREHGLMPEESTD